MQDKNRHHENDSSLIELRDLLADFTTGELTSEQSVKLEQLAIESEAAWQLYLEYMFLYGAVQQEYCNRGKVQFPPVSPTDHSNTQNPDSTSGPDDAIFPLLNMEKDLLSSDGIDAFGASKTPTPSNDSASGFFGNFNSSFIPGIITLVSAILILSVVVVLPIYWSNHAKTPGWSVVARINKTVNCHWAQDVKGLQEGTFLTAGQLLDLEMGLAEIEFSSGTKVILQGPSRFVVSGHNDSRLNQGHLAATVPDGAEGFTVNTPDMKVVDLGTEFGVSVDSDAKTEVCVFKGIVEVEVAKQDRQSNNPRKTNRTQKLRLKKNEAVRYHKTSSNIAPITADPQSFVRDLHDLKGITSDLAIANPSFETPDIRTIPQYRASHGDTNRRSIDGWKMSGNQSVAYQVAPYILPESSSSERIGPPATDGRQVVSLTLGAEPTLNIQPRSAWVYQSLGIVGPSDVGKKLRLSVDAGPRSKSANYSQGKGTLFAGFSVQVTKQNIGKAVGKPDSLKLEKNIKQLHNLEATLSISDQLIGCELFVVLAVSDNGNNSQKNQYYFDRVHVTVED